MPVCRAEGCNSPINSLLGYAKCQRCKADYHKRCLGLRDNVCTFSVAFCTKCSSHREQDTLLAGHANIKFESSLATSTQSSMASRLRHLETVLFSVLGKSFHHTLPTEGVVDKSLLQTFLWARVTEGANRNMIKAELKLWKEAILEIGNATFPNDWLDLKVNRLFPANKANVHKAKEAFAVSSVRQILCHLLEKSLSEDRIARALALRDIGILILGFGHLLRRSEITQVKLAHFNWEHSYLFIPKSKTDQASRGAYIPLLTSFFEVGQIRAWFDALMTEVSYWTGDAKSFLCLSYNSKSKTIEAGPLTNDAITARVRFWLENLLHMSTQRSRLFASHSLRRGGASHMRAKGVSDADIRSMGRWDSNCFQLYTDMNVRVVGRNVS